MSKFRKNSVRASEFFAKTSVRLIQDRVIPIFMPRDVEDFARLFIELNIRQS